mmetsp:Transcript_97097/g.274462  ORF Transcript_97097/g.274462 Transcript_97097/m.274462 type:complete len:162 (+) Transcript_97097:112-597(+)
MAGVTSALFFAAMSCSRGAIATEHRSNERNTSSVRGVLRRERLLPLRVGGPCDEDARAKRACETFSLDRAETCADRHKARYYCCVYHSLNDCLMKSCRLGGRDSIACDDGRRPQARKCVQEFTCCDKEGNEVYNLPGRMKPGPQVWFEHGDPLPGPTCRWP